MTTLNGAIDAVHRNSSIRLYPPYQTHGVRWMLRREMSTTSQTKGGLLADEMGLGKTVQTLAVVVANPSNKPTLVLCPKSLVAQWEQACYRFLGDAPLVLEARDAVRASSHDLERHRVIIAPYSALSSGSHAEGSPPNVLLEYHFHRVVLDEAHIIKNEKTRVHRLSLMLKADIRWALTGTPVTRVRNDFMAIMRFIRAEPGSVVALRERYCLRRTIDELKHVARRFELPPLRIRTHVVPFQSKEEADLYAEVREEGRLLAGYIETHGFDREANMGNLIEIVNRLRQITANPEIAVVGRGMADNWDGPVTKVTELVRLISEQPRGSKTLVFVHWNLEATRIVEALKTRADVDAIRLYGGMSNDQRNDAIASFAAAGGPSVLVAQIEVGGVGLNLQMANYVYINSLHWNPSGEMQAIGRAHRTGVEHVVTATRLIIKDTIDEHICGLQMKKLDTAASVLGDEKIRDGLDIRMKFKDFKALFD